MNKIFKAAGFVILIFAVLSCSLAGKALEKQLDKGMSAKRATTLWDDVPKMDGLDDSPSEDLPIAVKVAMHAYVDLVLNADKDSKKHITADWIVFDYKGSEEAVENFYTPEKMKSAGNWDKSKDMETPCLVAKTHGLPGNLCVYQKTTNGRKEVLAFIALANDKNKEGEAFVYFLRAAGDADPESNK